MPERLCVVPEHANPPDLSQYVDIVEAVEITGVSKQTVRRWAQLGYLPGTVKLPSNCLRFVRSELIDVVTRPMVER